MKLRSPLSLEPVTLLQESLICANHEQALWAGIAQIRAQKRQQQETAQREAKEDQERARILRRRRQSQADYAKKQAETAALSTALLYQTEGVGRALRLTPFVAPPTPNPAMFAPCAARHQMMLHRKHKTCNKLSDNFLHSGQPEIRRNGLKAFQNAARARQMLAPIKLKKIMHEEHAAKAARTMESKRGARRRRLLRRKLVQRWVLVARGLAISAVAMQIALERGRTAREEQQRAQLEARRLAEERERNKQCRLAEARASAPRIAAADVLRTFLGELRALNLSERRFANSCHALLDSTRVAQRAVRLWVLRQRARRALLEHVFDIEWDRQRRTLEATFLGTQGNKRSESKKGSRQRLAASGRNAKVPPHAPEGIRNRACAAFARRVTAAQSRALADLEDHMWPQFIHTVQEGLRSLIEDDAGALAMAERQGSRTRGRSSAEDLLSRALAVVGANPGAHCVSRHVVHRLAGGLRDRHVMLPMMAAALDGGAVFVRCSGHVARISCGDAAIIVGYPSWWRMCAQCLLAHPPASREFDQSGGESSDWSLPPPLRDVVQCCMLKGDHSELLGPVTVAIDGCSVNHRADKQQRHLLSPSPALPHHTNELPTLAGCGAQTKSHLLVHDENANVGDLRREARQREKLVMMQ